MLLANYASDSDSDASDNETPAPPRTVSKAAPAPAPAQALKPAIKKKPVKITLDLPKAADEDSKNGLGDDGEGVNEGVKKPKIAGGKGGSSLLGMLPAPKRKLPQSSATSRGSSLSVNKSMASSSAASSSIPNPLLGSTKAAVAASGSSSSSGVAPGPEGDDEDEDKEALLPPSLARKRKAKEKDEPLDLFGLASSSSTPAPSVPQSTSLKPPSISSAPIAPDYVPPPPTASDPYPGYYQLPSGEWRAYDPEYYHSFFPADADTDAGEEQDGRVGKHWNEFESGHHGLVEVSAMKGVEEARKEEERRLLTKRPKVGGDEFEYKPTGQIKGLATQRHQLSSLLNTAYTQREELEERIAANKKSMRMAGTKYGF